MSITGNILRLFIASLAVVAIAACSGAPRAPEFDSRGGSVTVGVAAVDIIDDDGQSNRLVAGAINRWAHQVFNPGADRGNLLVNINSARLSMREVEGEGGLKAFFTNEIRAVVRVEIEVFLSFTHPDGLNASLNLTSHAEAGIPENSTPAQSDAIRDEVIANAVSFIDREMRARLPEMSREKNWPQLSN